MGTGGPSRLLTPTYSLFCPPPTSGWLVTRAGIEPTFAAWEAAVLTAWPTGPFLLSFSPPVVSHNRRVVVHLQGLEPWTPWLRVRCSTSWAKGACRWVFPLHLQNRTIQLPALPQDFLPCLPSSSRSSPRVISTSQLNTLLCVHLWPIYDVVYIVPYSRMGWENLS